MNPHTEENIQAQAPSFGLFLEQFLLDKKASETFKSIASHYDIYVFSGIIRDFLTGDIATIPVRDIDFVIKGDINRLLVERLKVQFHMNGFGGIKLDRNGLRIDVWKIEDTWGIKKQKLLPSPENLIKTAFFNFQAIVYDYNKNCFIFDKDFKQFLDTQCMDVVYGENPDNALCVVNSIHYSYPPYCYNMSRVLAQWLVDHYDRSLNYEEVQQRHFGKVLYSSQMINAFMTNIINEITNVQD